MNIISFEAFVEALDLDERESFGYLLEKVGLLNTPKYPSGWGQAESRGWVTLKGVEYKAERTFSEGIHEGGIPIPGDTRWKILTRPLV